MKKTEFGDCILMEDLNLLVCRQQKVRIEPKTKILLGYLIRNTPKVVSREELLDQVWQGVSVSSDAFYRGICKLRKSLQAVGSEKVQLETIPKTGYRVVQAEARI